MPRAWNLFRYAQIKTGLTAGGRRAVWQRTAYTQHAHVHLNTLGENEYMIRFGNLLAAQDMIYLLGLSHSSVCLSVSRSVCFSAYLLSKELSLCLPWRIMLNGDFLCNHLIIHQFSKRPREAACPYYAEGHSNEKEDGRKNGKGLGGGNDQNGFELFACHRFLHLV